MFTKKLPKVAVIISTYNGENYIRAQLDSILAQTYPNIDIYIRDDGSTDGTLSILRQYAIKNKRIHLEEGKNLGYAPSFLKALASADGYSYYAFCDQDDVWLDFKIERAVEYLEKSSSTSQPLLYGSSYDYYDADLNFLKHAKDPKLPDSFSVSVMEGLTLGTCMVINQAARELLLRVDAGKIFMHDCLAYTICVAMGKVIYDPIPTIKYRRTGNNASPCGSSFFQLQIYRIKNFLMGPQLSKISQQNRHFAEVFHSELNSADQKTANLLIGKNTFSKRLRKTFYQKRWRRGLFDEISLRLLFLIGKM